MQVLRSKPKSKTKIPKLIPLSQQNNGRNNNNNTHDIITEYLEAMQTEINPSKSYRLFTTKILDLLSRFHNHKSFTKMTREDIIAYLNSLRKDETEDPLNKWIGTYNLYLVCIIRFFRWKYNPKLEPWKRPKPEIVNNILQLRRKEISVYEPSDLWTLEDDLLFLKWCPNIRDRCYHAISRDLSARPHEILALKIKDIVFKNVGNKQYAEVLVNGKTGTRHLPLIDSLPYVKEWCDQHPQRHNPEVPLICSLARKVYCKQMTVRGLYGIYEQYHEKYFPKLLKDSTMSKENRRKIEDLLKKPWNLYIRRHSSLTQKSKFLKEHILRQHAGWSARSQMHLKYVHYFGNESSESILQEYGIISKDNQETDILRPKQCPNCNEPNRPDQKFCVKCRMVLTHDAYTDTIESTSNKDKQIEVLIKKQEQFEQLIQSLIDSGQLKPSISIK